jgi:MFS family permease
MVQGAARSFTDLAVLRFISGAFEATADPAFVLITGTWFTRKQQPTIIGYWYAANGVGIAVGGLLGFGIGHIGGSLPSWRYEFILIGAVCSLWAVIMWIFIPDAPYNTKWLTREQAVLAVARKRDDGAGVDKKSFKMDQLWDTFKDPKTYLYFGLGFFVSLAGTLSLISG